MPAYVIGEVEITDPQAYQEYAKRVPEAIAKHGGRKSYTRFNNYCTVIPVNLVYFKLAHRQL